MHCSILIQQIVLWTVLRTTALHITLFQINLISVHHARIIWIREFFVLIVALMRMPGVIVIASEAAKVTAAIA